MNDIAFDLIIFVAGAVLAMFAAVAPLSIGIGALFVTGVVFAVTGLVWLLQDFRMWAKYRRPLQWPETGDTQPF